MDISKIKEITNRGLQLKRQYFAYGTVDSITTVGDIKYKGASIILLGTAAPSIAPDFEGQTYINTTSPGTVYTAKGVSSVSDWKQTSN